MRINRNIVRILFSPYTIALFITLIIIYLLPPYFNKYNATLIKKSVIAKNLSFRYVDLNNDGMSEKIELETTLDNFIQLRVHEKEGIIEQWNFNGKLLGGDNPIYGDVNGDSLKEIFIFTYSRGKVLLNVINPFTFDILLHDKFICSYKPISQHLDCEINLCGFYDVDNDGSYEVYFSTATGYSINPRKLFSLDCFNDTLYASDNGYNVVEQPVGYDLDDDGELEFFGKSAAVGNSDITAKLSDHFSWLMVFDREMHLKFEPIKIGYYPSQLDVKPFTIANKKRLLLFNNYQGDRNFRSSFALYNNIGKKIKEKSINNLVELRDADLFMHSDDYTNLFLLQSNGRISKIDSNLNTEPIQQTSATYNLKFFSLDLDTDYINEGIILPYGLGKAIIYRHDFSSPVTLEVQGGEELRNYSLLQNGQEKSVLYMEFENAGYYYTYGENSLHFLKYLVYTGIYGTLLLLMWGIQHTQRYRIQQKVDAEKRIYSLQLKAIKNQIDPHCTLNIINSIGSLIYKNDKDSADYVFGKYSKLLRSTLLNSERIITTIGEELEYVKTYLDLEKFRMNEKFSYSISIDKEVDQTVKIPRMLIHTFIENAIKHGIKNLEADGMIDIAGRKKGNLITINIIDNGIGRKKANELNEYSTGKGLRIIDQIINLYYKLENKKISYEIKDGNDKGTEVIITLNDA